ncbi:MAG: prepilin-type N-terminal cleavage/methylation domain-containing protein [Lachnospiraceae bacterium]|nr:prepilin-type N-terminal cleavage/methylation domain-containing protein [Lachnospiraceae bacterium]
MKERKLNNKGFSLVELIIVIAIMVILVVVFAPQYLRFVNNSRISTDVQTASNMVTAVEASIAEGNNPFGANTGTVTFTSAGAVPTGVNGLTAWPDSRLDGTWAINGNDSAGVTSVTLTVGGTDYQCYPDNESRTAHGINNMHDDTTAAAQGLRQ